MARVIPTPQPLLSQSLLPRNFLHNGFQSFSSSLLMEINRQAGAWMHNLETPLPLLTQILLVEMVSLLAIGTLLLTDPEEESLTE